MKTRNHPDYSLNDNMIVNINPIQDGLFRGCSRMRGEGEEQKVPTSLYNTICHTYPTLMKLDTVIPYLKMIQKTHRSRDKSLAFY